MHERDRITTLETFTTTPRLVRTKGARVLNDLKRPQFRIPMVDAWIRIPIGCLDEIVIFDCSEIRLT